MAHTIQDKAMIVRLFIATWTARKYDKKVSDRAAQDFKADNNVGRYNKILVAQQEIDKIIKIVSEARNWHYNNTLPWQDNGERLLPASQYLDYTKKMSEFRQQFEEAVKKFLNDYPQLVEDAKNRLGNMYNSQDYPSTKEIAHRFGYEVSVNPVPSAKDFRVDLQASEIRKIQEDIERRVKAAVSDAMRDLWDRVRILVKRMVERLGDRDSIFRDSLVENLVEICNIIPKLNITNDPNLDKIRKEIEEKLCAATPEQLRKDEKVREKVADQAKSILDAMDGYMGVKK